MNKTKISRFPPFPFVFETKAIARVTLRLFEVNISSLAKEAY
jgi:hypothetical protein